MSKYTVTVEIYDANSYHSIYETDWRVRVICPLGFRVNAQFSDHSKRTMRETVEDRSWNVSKTLGSRLNQLGSRLNQLETHECITECVEPTDSYYSGNRLDVCSLTHLYTLTADIQDEVNFLVLYLARLLLEGEDTATLSISFEVEASF